MSRFTNPKRWMAQSKRKGIVGIGDDGITPDEAFEAVQAMMLQTGHVVERIYEYDKRRDWIKATGRNADGKLIDITIRGETVAKVVIATRMLKGTGGKRLIRPSETGRPINEHRFYVG